jgi:capsular exopolysaccharide synthesis family protein
LGLLLALGIIVFWEFLDDTIKSTDDLTQFKELNLLGAVGKIKDQEGSKKPATHLRPSSPSNESYRMIRNKIRFSSVGDPPKSIVVTSAEPEEGKSITAAKLAINMAQANIKTILVDAELRHPVLHQIFNLWNISGLADLLSAPETDVQECLQRTSLANLQVITSGKASHDQSERLHPEHISKILKHLEEKADVIIIDSPPVLLTADAVILSNQADGVIIAARAGKSKPKAIRQALIDLHEANAKLLGCVFYQTHEDNSIASYRKYKREKNRIEVKSILNIIRWYEKITSRLFGLFQEYRARREGWPH